MAPVDFDIASFVHEKAKQKGLELLLNVGVEKSTGAITWLPSSTNFTDFPASIKFSATSKPMELL